MAATKDPGGLRSLDVLAPAEADKVSPGGDDRPKILGRRQGQRSIDDHG